MRRRQSLSVALFALLPLAGCAHRVKVAAAPAPPVAMVSVPPPSHPTEPLPEEPVVTAPVTPPPPPPVKTRPPRRRSTPQQPPVQTAVATPPPAPIDLGQLTTGGDNNTQLMQQTEELMRAQQKRLIGIPTTVAATHTQQIEQARLFLRQADDAWKKLDVEGARTLATKAKILLDEILE